MHFASVLYRLLIPQHICVASHLKNIFQLRLGTIPTVFIKGMVMLYRLDGSDYLYVDWDRLDACLKPSDRDKAGRLCGKRATSNKRQGKIKPGSEEAKKLAGEVRKSQYKKPGGSPQQLTKIKNRRKEEAQLQRNFMYGEGGQSPQQKTAAKRKFGVIEGGGKGSDEKVDPRMAKANREIRKLTMQMPATMANTDKALAALKETAERTKKRRERSKARKPRRK